MKYKYTKEELKNAIKTSLTISEALKKLNLKPMGGNYRVIKKQINSMNIDISHLLGRSISKGTTHNHSISTPLKDILIKNSTYGGSGTALKRKLFKANLFKKKCYKCNLTEWLGRSISLEIEHINGNNLDNRIENLTLLCPNCHAQTKTYRRRKDALK